MTLRRRYPSVSDVVVCVDASDSDGVLVEGALYVVTGRDKHTAGLVLHDVESTRRGGWDEARFRVHRRTSPYATSVRNSVAWVTENASSGSQGGR